MHEWTLKVLLIGVGGLLLSPLVAVSAWSIFGSIWGNAAIVFMTGGWFLALRHFVSRDRPFPIALSWEEEQRRRAFRNAGPVSEDIGHRA
ncbi:MAG: hypothetical protein AAGJ32_10385 [Pseudomonadota bacterium]